MKTLSIRSIPLGYIVSMMKMRQSWNVQKRRRLHSQRDVNNEKKEPSADADAAEVVDVSVHTTTTKLLQKTRNEQKGIRRKTQRGAGGGIIRIEVKVKDVSQKN